MTLPPGDCRRARTAHPPSNDPDDDVTPSELLGGGVAGGGGATAGAGTATDGAGAVGLAASPNADAPSELLGPMLEEWSDLLGLVLAQLDPTDKALLS
jgi:hypothetical protein